jgi:hypothetical protein
MSLPAYTEFATAGASQFALSYARRTFTDTRTELGAWFDSNSLASGWGQKGLTLYPRVGHMISTTRALRPPSSNRCRRELHHQFGQART